MKHVFYLLTLLLCMLSMSSCTQEADSIGMDDSAILIGIANYENEPEPSLYVNSVELNRVILKNVDTHKVHASRSTGYSVSVLNDKDGNPACYVVNFDDNDGFMVVSAVKTATPLLAFNSTGNFRPEDNTPAKLWQDLTVEGVSESKTLPEDSVKNAAILWLQYERYNTLLSRSEPEDYDDYDTWSEDLKQKYRDSQAILNDSISKWLAKNETIISVEDTKTLQKYLSDYDIESARQSCLASVYYRFESRWKQLSIIRIYEEFSSHTYCDNFIKSTWHQIMPYNTDFPILEDGRQASVGCGPLSIGRLMRYHQWPESYNWNEMPLTYPKVTTTNFLFYIAKQCNAKYGIPTTIEDEAALKFLANNNYTVTPFKPINDKSFEKAFAIKHPVIICADNSNPQNTGDVKGHMWLMSGISNLSYIETAAAYTVNLPYQVNRHWAVPQSSASSTAYYMNWGFNYCEHDGFFVLGYTKLQDGNNYNIDMKWAYPIPNK